MYNPRCEVRPDDAQCSRSVDLDQLLRVVDNDRVERVAHPVVEEGPRPRQAAAEHGQLVRLAVGVATAVAFAFPGLKRQTPHRVMPGENPVRNAEKGATFCSAFYLSSPAPRVESYDLSKFTKQMFYKSDTSQRTVKSQVHALPSVRSASGSAFSRIGTAGLAVEGATVEDFGAGVEGAVVEGAGVEGAVVEGLGDVERFSFGTGVVETA